MVRCNTTLCDATCRPARTPPALWTAWDFRLPRPSLAQSVWPLAAYRSGRFAAASHAFRAEVFPFLAVEILRVGLLRAGLGNRSFLPTRQLCCRSRRSRLRSRGAAVVVAGVRAQPAPAPMMAMAADRAMVGSSFMDFSPKERMSVVGLQQSCERAARRRYLLSRPQSPREICARTCQTTERGINYRSFRRVFRDY